MAGISIQSDKFVVRMPEGLRQRVEDLAASNHTSMNTEIVQAIESHLAGNIRRELLLNALEVEAERLKSAH